MHRAEKETIRRAGKIISVIYPIIILWSPHLSHDILWRIAIKGITFR